MLNGPERFDCWKASRPMCFFLTISVPEKYFDRIPEAFGHGFELRPAENTSLLAALPSRHVAYVLASGGCSCDLYACPKSSDQAREHLRRKYAKRGWSDGKIARALEQAAHQQQKRSKRVAFSGLRDD